MAGAQRCQNRVGQEENAGEQEPQNITNAELTEYYNG